MKRCDLHEYQNYCVEYLKTHPEAMLFLSMGLGKSVTALTAILDLMFDSFDVEDSLAGRTRHLGTCKLPEDVCDRGQCQAERSSYAGTGRYLRDQPGKREMACRLLGKAPNTMAL